MKRSFINVFIEWSMKYRQKKSLMERAAGNIFIELRMPKTKKTKRKEGEEKEMEGETI